MLVRGAGQEVEHTASRRSGPRRWLRAVAWLIAEGMHPRAGATTLRLAEDLAARMDYTTGHVRYCLAETAARLRVAQATVKRHAAVLRELGALAWAVRGTKANVRRLLGLPGYAATATVYAAVIPPVYDQAHGHQVLGSGYEARVIIHCAPAEPVDNSPAGDLDAPPSLRLVEEEGKLEVESGFKDTSRERASRPTASAPSSSKSSKRSSKDEGGPRRPAGQVARDCLIAARVRPLVNWTQREGIRRLAFALRPLIDQGLDSHDIAAQLHAWGLLWRPEQPAAYIRARLRQQAVQEAVAAATVHPLDNPEMQTWLIAAAGRAHTEEDLPAARTDADRKAARDAGAVALTLVADHLEDYGPDDTIDLYGLRLASLAASLTASGNATVTTRW